MGRAPGSRRARVWGRSSIASGAVVVAVVVAACVSPTPTEGEPVPALAVTVSGPEPGTGLLEVTVTPVDFAPTVLEVRLGHGLSGPTRFDGQAPPYSVTYDTSGFPDGTYVALALGRDGTYTVAGAAEFTVRRPNVVVVFVDDLDEVTSPYLDAMPQTEALVADRGLTFTHAVANNPACCPSRALTLTGRYPHNTGVEANRPPVGGFEAFVGNAEDDTVATRLQAAGYTTGFLGKYLNGYHVAFPYVPPGWDTWFGLDGDFYSGYGYTASDDGTVVSFGQEPEDYQTDVLADRSVEFIETATAADDPFFLFVAPSAPHVPLPPAPRDADHPWVAALIPRSPNWDEADVSDKPTWLREFVPQMSLNLYFYRTWIYRNGMGSMLAVDDLVARIVEALDHTGELDDTLVVFTSDNGLNHGAHRLGAKLAPYEESIRVPLIVAGPGVAQGERDELVGLVDLTPTILDLAGLDVDDLDGRSPVSLLGETPGPWTDEAFLHYRDRNHTLAQVVARQSGAVPTYRGVRTDTHLYLQWYGEPPHEYELYDLVADPYQLDNLLATPEGAAEHAGIVAELDARLQHLATCAGATCRE